MSHAFGELLAQYRVRKRGLSQAKLAQIVGYDPAVIACMAQGTRDLTGPSGRERIVRIISALRDEGVLHSLEEANALLSAAEMPPLYAGLPVEANLIRALSSAALHEQPPALEWFTRRGVMHNLPVLLTSFVGREQEIAELMALLPATRLLTLTGAGGVGKSRLAQQLASEVLGQSGNAEQLADGVWLVQLAPISNPSLVADAIAAALSLRPSGRPTREILLEYLHDRHLLLILDNCEHVIQACAELVEALLHACPHVRMIATSREPLNIAGEVTWRVPPLNRATALRLFADRARAVLPNFRPSEQNDALVTHICERLDGIPLAIELAVTRLRALSVEQIAARLDDRFRLLTDGNRTALPRHRTLRAMIDWSYDLLPEQERHLLRQVSVFAGGWTLELAEAMCGSAGALDGLAQLVSKSLVSRRDTALGTRYELHETIRQYARDKLIEQGELDEALRRHAEACFDFVTSAHSHIQFSDQQRWIAVLEADLDNIRAALTWSLSESGDPGLGARLAINLGGMWLQNRRLEGFHWVQPLVKVMPASLPLEIRGPLTLEYAYLMDTTRPPELWDVLRQLRDLYAREDPENVIVIDIPGYQSLLAETAEESSALMNEAVALSLRSHQRHARYWVHYFLGLHLGPLRWRLDMAGAQAAFEAMLIVTTDELDSFGQALAHEGMMYVALHELALERAAALAARVLTLAEPVNAEMPILSALHTLAEIALMEGRLDEAQNYIDAAQSHNARYGHLAASAQQISLRMRLALAQGNDAAVRAHVTELRATLSAPSVWTMGNASALPGVETLAALETVEGRHVQAAHLFGAAEAERERRHEPWWPKDHVQLDPYVNALREHLGEEAFVKAWTEGRAMSLDQVFNRVSSP